MSFLAGLDGQYSSRMVPSLSGTKVPYTEAPAGATFITLEAERLELAAPKHDGEVSAKAGLRRHISKAPRSTTLSQ